MRSPQLLAMLVPLVLWLSPPVESRIEDSQSADVSGSAVVQQQPTGVLPSGCVDSGGVRRKIGEEWTVRNHFVLLCHEVLPSANSWRILRVEVVACLREDGKTRLPIGEEAREANGATLVCRRLGAEPAGEVRREWRAGSTFPTTPAGGATTNGTMDGVGCFGRAPGTRFQIRAFELECGGQFELPRLVACVVPEMKGEKVPVGGTAKVGPFTVSCEQLPDGSFRYRWI